MQGIIIISVIASFSSFPIILALSCYHCVSGGITVAARSSCNDKNNMKSLDCGDSSNYVETEFGFLPKDIAVAMGYTGVSASIKADYQCMKYIKSGTANVGQEATVSYEVNVRGCLGSLPGSTVLWNVCEDDDDCHLCDSDDCNSSSIMVSSLILILFALLFSGFKN